MGYDQQNLLFLQETLREMQHTANQAILMCACAPDGLSAEQLRTLLSAIEQITRVQMKAEELVKSYADGPDTTEAVHSVLAKLTDEARQLGARWGAREDEEASPHAGQ